jgi:hypothetical protein
MIQSGLLEEPVDVAQLYTNEFIEAEQSTAP